MSNFKIRVEDFTPTRTYIQARLTDVESSSDILAVEGIGRILSLCYENPHPTGGVLKIFQGAVKPKTQLLELFAPTGFSETHFSIPVQTGNPVYFMWTHFRALQSVVNLRLFYEGELSLKVVFKGDIPDSPGRPRERRPDPYRVPGGGEFERYWYELPGFKVEPPFELKPGAIITKTPVEWSYEIATEVVPRVKEAFECKVCSAPWKYETAKGNYCLAHLPSKLLAKATYIDSAPKEDSITEDAIAALFQEEDSTS